MATNPRSFIIQPADTVSLRARFRGADGQLTDLDGFPEVTIVQPSGGIVVGPTSAGVYRLAVGEYGFDYDVGLFPAIGVWKDVWTGILGGFEVRGEFSFIVGTTQTPAINTDGYCHLGDDPGFCYSQTAICNINHLLKSLRARLKSSGKHRTQDEWGNVVYKDCDVYEIDELVSFVAQALSMFNEIPHFTSFTFEDTPIIEQFHDVLVQGASLIALSAQALIERGREFQIQDNGIGFTPPTISELLNTQWSTELTNWWEKVKLIKHNMKPSPTGLGTLRFMGVAPQFKRLRHLRQRQIY
jgi:hypothetical protein